MSCENRFFYCKHCGNLVGLIHSSGVPMICCGEEMTCLLYTSWHPFAWLDDDSIANMNFIRINLF